MAEIRSPGASSGAPVPIYKVLIIGDSNVGKTSLINRYCDDSFQGSLVSTVGIDYKTKFITIHDEKIKLQIWDTAGQERFRTLTNAYFRGACGAVLLYDITSRDTFTNVVGWMESVEEHASSSICTVIVGHKVDLQDERTVTTQEGQKLAENYDCLFFEASAKLNSSCDKIFSQLVAEIKTRKETAGSVHQYSSSQGGAHLASGSQLTASSSPSSSSKQSSCC